jgi:hypothetical protein
MSKCEIGECGISCIGGCYCMDVGKGGGCECWCDPVMRFTKPRGFDRADPELVVDFVATDMPLARLAAHFDFLFPDQILIPASQVHKHVSTEKIQQIKLGDLIEKLELVPTNRPLIGRDFSDFREP